MNKLIEIQNALYNQIKRLDDDNIMNNENRETQRSGALSQSAGAYIKSVQTQIKVKEMVGKNPQAENTLLKEFGVLDEK